MNGTLANQETNGVRESRDDQPQRQRWVRPPVNIVETKDGFHLEAEMPGVNKDGLEILLEGSELAIVGKRPVNADNGQLLYRESIDCDYRRSFELNPTIDTSRISARMESGILFLDLPKAEKVKPRRVAVE